MLYLFFCLSLLLHLIVHNHNKTVWKHITTSVSLIDCDLLLRMVMLFHDIGKPLAKWVDKKGREHFNKHPKFSAELTRIALERLKYPTAFVDDVVTLVIYHDERSINTKSDIKRILNKIGEKNFKRLLKIQRADIFAQSNYKREEKLKSVDIAESLFKEIISLNECYTLKQLQINGSDLIHLGITQGVQIGSILNSLLELVIDDKLENNTDILKEKALEFLKQN